MKEKNDLPSNGVVEMTTTPAINQWPERLKALRKRLGLTQTEAAAAVRVTRRAWTNYEASRIPPKPIQLLIELLEKGKIR